MATTFGAVSRAIADAGDQLSNLEQFLGSFFTKSELHWSVRRAGAESDWARDPLAVIEIMVRKAGIAGGEVAHFFVVDLRICNVGHRYFVSAGICAGGGREDFSLQNTDELVLLKNAMRYRMETPEEFSA